MTTPPRLAALHIDVEGDRVLLIVSRLDQPTAAVCKLTPQEAETLARSLRTAAAVIREASS